MLDDGRRGPHLLLDRLDTLADPHTARGGPTRSCRSTQPQRGALDPLRVTRRGQPVLTRGRRWGLRLSRTSRPSRVAGLCSTSGYLHDPVVTWRFAGLARSSRERSLHRGRLHDRTGPRRVGGELCFVSAY